MSLLTNLVSYYKFDENTGTTVGDSVGSNTGTWDGSPSGQWTTGKINSGGYIDGNLNHVTIPDSPSLDFTTAVSISCWIYKSDLAGNRDIISKRSAWGTTSIPFELTTDGTNISWRVIGNSTYPTLNASLVINTWYHIVATWDGTTQYIYVNGSSIGSTSRTGTITTNTTAVEIGMLPGGGENFLGTIDEVGIWSRALTSTEVTTLYNSGAGLQYPFTTSSFIPRLSLLGMG